MVFPSWATQNSWRTSLKRINKNTIHVRKTFGSLPTKFHVSECLWEFSFSWLQWGHKRGLQGAGGCTPSRQWWKMIWTYNCNIKQGWKKKTFSAERPAAALTSPAHCQRSVSPQLELLVCSFHNPGFRSHFGKILHTNATCSGCPPVAHTVLVSAPSASGNAGFWSESEDFQQWILLNG